MKKALLLSVVASSMIMAGGDIAPVEPVVETPAPVVSGWEFSGTGVVYYQTHDKFGDSDLFKQESSAADVVSNSEQPIAMSLRVSVQDLR